MLKLLLFITIIISINCVAKNIPQRSKVDLEKERNEFYIHAQPINRIRHAGNLPLLSAEELTLMIIGLNSTINKFDQDTRSSRVYRELTTLQQQLSFRLKNKIYRSTNPDEINDVQIIRKKVIFD